MCVWGLDGGGGGGGVGRARGHRIRRPGMTAGRLGSSKTPVRPADRWGWSHGVSGKRAAPPRLENWHGDPYFFFFISNTISGAAAIWAPLKGPRDGRAWRLSV